MIYLPRGENDAPRARSDGAFLHRGVAAAALILGAGASGCSCEADVEAALGSPTICVRPEGTAECDADGSAFDWGSPAAGQITTRVLEVTNTSSNGVLRLDDIHITNELGGARMFDVALCGPTCDEVQFGLPMVLDAGATARLTLSFDATNHDGTVPVEALQIVSDSAVDEVAPAGVYVRPFAGVTDGCLDNRVNANGDKSDGCECAPTVDGLETCDGLDNDCDGHVDEDVAGEGIPCETGIAGDCARGMTGCVDAEFICVPDFATGPEVCDGLDNDCDGLIDEENTWFSFNEGLSGGNMALVAYDARVSNVAYAVTGTRVFRSDDGGSSFQLVGDALHAINALGFPADDVGKIFGASNGGLIASEDGGATWQQVSLSSFPLVSLLVHPADPGRIFAGTWGGGIYRSTNAGLSFSAVNQGVPFSRVASFFGHPTNPDMVIAGVELLNDQSGINFEGEILRTTNGGANWVTVTTGVGTVRRLAGCPSDGDVVYAASYKTGVLRSLDGGANWNLTGLDGQRVNDVDVASADCSVVYSSTEDGGVFHSGDGGGTFDGPHLAGLDIQKPGATTISSAPTDFARVLLANHSGVFLSEDAASSWQRVPSIEGAIVRALDVSPVNPSMVWMSSWGQGQWVRDGVSNDWSRVPSSSLPRDWLSTVKVDPFDASRVWAGAVNDLWQSTNGGVEFVNVPGPLNVLTIAYDPSDEQNIYLGTQLGGVWKSVNGGQTYFQVNVGLPSPWATSACVCQDVRVVVVDATSPDVIYAGTNLQGLFKSVNGGAAWEATAPSLASERIDCLVQEANGDLLACVAGEGIWRSTDSAQTFTKVTQGLPALNNSSSIFISEATGEIYVTSDGAVYRTEDKVVWEDMDSSCLPSSGAGTPVVMADGTDKFLLIGTGGVGVYALRLAR